MAAGASVVAMAGSADGVGFGLAVEGLIADGRLFVGDYIRGGEQYDPASIPEV